MDKESLFSSLNAHSVDYIVIGAAAFPAHGYGRATLDVDIFIRPTAANAKRTRAALAEAGYDVTDVSEEELLRYKVLLRQYLVELDVHPFVAGANFDDLWAHKVAGQFGKVAVWYPSLDDLIAMKRAAGRPKDLEDLRALEAIKQRTRGPAQP